MTRHHDVQIRPKDSYGNERTIREPITNGNGNPGGQTRVWPPSIVIPRIGLPYPASIRGCRRVRTACPRVILPQRRLSDSRSWLRQTL